MEEKYKEECKYEKRLFSKLQSLPNAYNLDFIAIRKAICFARKYHDGQLRKSGEPFYSHPIEVAYMVSDYLPKTDIIIASILHDIVEDTEMSAGMILDNFGRRVEQIVDRLTRDRPDGTKLSVEQILNNAYQAEDNEVLLIKLVDRLHNLQTLKHMKIEKQKEIAAETLKNFIILSLHIGILSIEKTITQYCMDILYVEGDYLNVNFTKEDFCLNLVAS